MKKILIGLVLVAAATSTNTYAGDEELALIAGLAGLALIIGDGHTSFGVHYDRGYYNYRGYRYSNRAAYLRAVARYERERRYAQRYYYHPGYSNSSRLRYYNDYRYNGRSYNDRYDRDDRRNYNDRDRDQDRDRDRDRDDSRERNPRTDRN